MNMLLCKRQSKAGLIHKIHKGQLIPDTSSPNQLIIVTDRSVEVLIYLFDDILNQYLTSSILNQAFPFQILDSAVVSSNLILLTVCGLVLLNYSQGSFIPIDHIEFNTGGEMRDMIMYLKLNPLKEIVVAYSNTNLFIIYLIRNNRLIRINSNFYSTGFNIFKVFEIKLSSNGVSGVFLLTKNDKDYEIIPFFFNTVSNESLPQPIAKEEYTDQINQYVQLMTLIQNQMRSLSDYDIYDCVFSTKMQYVFLISELSLIIFKIVSSSMLERVKTIDFESPKYYVSSLSLGGNYIQLTFDTDLYLFKISDTDLNISNIVIQQGIKKRIEGFESILLVSESAIVLYYDCNASVYFIQYSLSNGTEEVHLKLLGENVNQSVFAFDSAVIRNEARNGIYSICGLKGNSKLIKYEDAFIETKLKEMRLLNVNNVFILSCDNNSNDSSNSNSSNRSMKICVFNYIDKAALFAIKADFSIEMIKEYNDNIVDLYSIPNSDNRYVLVLNRAVVIVQLDINGNDKSKTIKSEESFPLTSKQAIILSSSHYDSITNLFYLICNVASNEIIVSSIDSNYTAIKELIRLDLGEEVTVSAMASITILNAMNTAKDANSTISILIGTYQSHLQLIHYNINEKTFSILKENKYDIVPDTHSDKIITESIKAIDDYIFISTRTGEFCILRYDYPTKKIECLLSNKFTSSSLCLHISHIDKRINGYSLDLFNELSAFNFSIDIKPSVKVHTKKYIIKSNDQSQEGIKSENNDIVFFKKMTIGNDNGNGDIGIHLYQNGTDFSFGYFSSLNSSDGNMMVINDIMHFHSNETAKRIISIANEILVILTDANKLYIYSPTEFKFIREISIDPMFKGIIHSMKEASVTIPDEAKVINCVCLCGEYHDETINSKRGVLFIYEYSTSKRDLKVIAKIPKFPKPVYDVCCTRNYFITGMEGYICFLPYEVDTKTNSIIIKKEAKQQQYMNRIVSLYSIDSNSALNFNSVLVGDFRDSFQLIDIEITQLKFDVCAADLANRSLAKAVPLDHSRNKVMLLEKNGSLSLFKLSNELYERVNSVDLKEYVNNVIQTEDDGYYCTGLLGSLYLIKAFDQKMADECGLTSASIEKLYAFQCNVIKAVSMYYFNSALPIEKMMQMSCPLKNVILFDLLESLCKYHSHIVKNVSDYDEMYKLFTFINEEVM